MALVHKRRYSIKIQGKGAQDPGTGLEERDIYLDGVYFTVTDFSVEKVMTREMQRPLNYSGVAAVKITEKFGKFKFVKPLGVVQEDTGGWDGPTILPLSWVGFRPDTDAVYCKLILSDPYGINGGVGKLEASNSEGETIRLEGMMGKVSIIGEVGKVIQMEIEGLGKIVDSITWSSYEAGSNTESILSAIAGGIKIGGAVVDGIKSWRLDVGGDVKICEGVEQDDGVYLIYRPEVIGTLEIDPVDSATARAWRESEEKVNIQILRHPVGSETEAQILIDIKEAVISEFSDEWDEDILRRRVKFEIGWQAPNKALVIYPSYDV